jgi:hypothetical protein
MIPALNILLAFWQPDFRESCRDWPLRAIFFFEDYVQSIGAVREDLGIDKT